MKCRNLRIALVITVYCVHFTARAEDEQAALQKAKQELRAKGFETDLSDFNLAATSDEFKRSAALKATDPLSWSVGRSQPGPRFDARELRTIVTSNTAEIFWDQPSIADENSPKEDWQQWREMLEEYGPRLDAAAEALASGQYAFDLQASAGNAMLLPHLSPVKKLSQIFACRAMLELHDGHCASAWSNVLATTRVVTHWRIEPTLISYVVRFGCATTAFDAAWQALQTNHWTDAQLSALQKEWESLNWFSGLDEMTAFEAASAAQMCQMERTNSRSLKLPLQDAVRHPTYAIEELKYYQQQKDYLQHGSYDDEKCLLQYYFQCQQDLRQTLQCKTWSEMQKSAAMTNDAPFQSKHRSRLQSRLNLQSMRRMVAGGNGERLTLLGRVADIEARRRVLVTAIALERFRVRYHSYPAKLAQLVPDFLTTEPVDFCDGKPLRYKIAEPRFVLYSIGLDGIDDGGAIADRDRRRRARNDEAAQKHVADDIVWPRPALAEDLRVRERELARQNQEQMLRGIAWRRKGALENVKHVEELSRLYGRPRLKMTNEPTYAGRPLKQLLAKGNSVGHPDPTLEELLTLQQIKTGQEPEVVTFELPIQHDVTTNLGTLLLLIDPETPRAVRTWEHKGAEQPELHRVIKGTNGNCRIEWSTIFVPPGKHFVMTELAVEGVRSRFNEDEWYVVHGPMVPFEITNVCYFDIVSATYDPTNGGPFYGFTAEPNARYQVELKSPAGKRVCGFKGETTNGVIDLRWDAKYEDGKLYGGGWVDTFWDIELTGSGRHQKLKGP